MGERSVRRGEIYLLDFQEAGGRLTKFRPGLIVQNDRGNQRGLETVVAAIRAATPGKWLPVHVGVRRGIGGLDKDSVVDAGHLTTVRKGELGKRLGTLPDALMDSVDRALAVSLGLEP